MNAWVKLFKNELTKISGRQPLKTYEVVWSASRPYHFKFFKGYLLQILLSPFLNTLIQNVSTKRCDSIVIDPIVCTKIFNTQNHYRCKMCNVEDKVFHQ